MEVAWLARARWRWRGAWMWPAFVVFALVDGLIGHALPLNESGQSVVSGVVAGLFFNLIGIILLSRPVGALLRRRRRDLPGAIARNYAGTFAVVLVTVGFAGIGLARQSTIRSENAALRDAATRAAAYIGDRAPAEFRANAAHLDTITIQPGAVFRVCVLSDRVDRYYCVIVREQLPLARSVVPDGSEPNSSLALDLN